MVTTITTDKNASKRKTIVTFSTITFPLYYLYKNRYQIYRGSSLIKEFYLKELIARSFFGLVFGFAIGAYFYPMTKIEKIENEQDKETL
jgi:hypothetical protein